ncbi:hypothetical protein F5B22DRAFT_635692 [Xylaria bambusicola]|uniref:uncharacterized protein n=1 Tax=Xylaria bambusicola TaxID=326684 RepID=UPI002008D680|nr:uncharacterized protein F5B22DRAFT_635692 [Xylaria bambusicola]KAI0517830.1 hypothetical protein F5B22DRAFT_635692 [Xylaria bambusicola]
MLIPSPAESEDSKDVAREFTCAAKDCLYMVTISVIPPKFHTWQIDLMRDEERILRNLQLARNEDPDRFADFPAAWFGGSSTVTTLAQYIEDRLKKPSGQVLKIKKRNKRFRVSFGNDLDDILRYLGFEERKDEDDEECWYITEPEPIITGSPTPVNTRRAHLEDTLEELRSLVPGANTTPAWLKLMDAFPGYAAHAARPGVSLVSADGILEDDLVEIGCLKEFPPQWFSWAAILLADICPSRRDLFLDAGLRCISERNEEASLNIIIYRSQFDQRPSLDPEVKAAFDYFFENPTYTEDKDTISKAVSDLLESNSTRPLKHDIFRHLEIISNYLGADLQGDVARGDSLATAASSTGPKSRRMSIRSASRLLKVDASFTADMIREFAANVDELVDRERVVEALEVLSDLKFQQDQHGEAQSLKEAADFLRETGGIASRQKGNANGEPSSITDPAVSFSTPPGLKNIGNTCYLNSLLQYFYNVKPVREMVLNHDQIQLGLDDTSVSNRWTGGNGTRVTLEEAIVARQFIEELSRLFLELQTTTGASASPSQKLANTALSSAKEILTSQDQNQPPPLPARPSPIPPSSPNKDLDTVNVTVEPIREHRDTASSVSSQTLVNEMEDAETETPAKELASNVTSAATGHTRDLSPEDRALSDTVEHIEDVVMEEPPLPLSLDQKISQISERLERSDRSGTSQQDVEEIIGNILEHLMRAIHPNGPMDGKPNLQADKITELFFTTIVNSTIKTTARDAPLIDIPSTDEDILNEEVVPERWITAFPHPNKELKTKNTLYEALDRYFSYELLSDGGLARYTTIRKLPPIVHICIQRTDASGVKNKNPVIIPEQLYMDRYMETAPGSDLWRTRRRVWAIQERIKELDSRALDCTETVLVSPEAQGWNKYADVQAREKTQPVYQDTIDLNSELWRDIPRVTKPAPETGDPGPSIEAKPSEETSTSNAEDIGNLSFADALWEAGRRMDDADYATSSILREEEAHAFDSMKQHKFQLHAIICHGGGMSAGHYWVWVRDFKNQVWYKYNDSLVTKDERDSEQVVDELNNSGDPYYVAYVRDELKDSLVEVPQRAQAADGDVDMINASQELEVIDSIAVDNPPQPANSPANTPVPEAVMGDAPPLKLQE